MNSLIYVVLFIVFIYMMFKNIKLAKRAKHTKAYIKCSDGIFMNEPDALDRIDDYISNDNSVEFQNKARVLKVYQQIRMNINPIETINEIELYETIYTKGKLDIQKFEFNSDTYFWLLLDMIKIHTSNFNNCSDSLRVVVDKYIEDIKTDVAVELFYDIDKSFKEIDDKGITFYKKLISGDYEGYSYDKRLIGFYKRVAATMLVYLKQEISKEEMQDLKTFATMKAGKLIMTDLGIIDDFKSDCEFENLNEDNNIENIDNNIEDESKLLNDEVDKNDKNVDKTKDEEMQ